MAWPGPELGREGRGESPSLHNALALSLEWCWPSPCCLPAHPSVCLPQVSGNAG